jgi:hypothetical protein
MRDGLIVAGALLVVGPLLGAVPVAYPPLLRVWSASREDHIAIVAAHRRAWWLLNAGFVLATVSTTGGLAALASSLGDEAQRAAVAAVAVVYAVAGALWCVVLAIRARTTPLLGDLGAADEPPAPAEVLLGAATGGMFAAFVLVTGAVLIALGLVLVVAGGVAPLVAWLAVGIAMAVIASQLATGDAIPAVLYLPTLLVGVALLAGWT